MWTGCIRPARAGEAAGLTGLCRRAKAHWGYDPAFMRLADSALNVTPAMIGDGRVLVAEEQAGEPLGVAAVAPAESDGSADLSLLFVEPHAMGRGIGRRLFAAIAVKARAEGSDSLLILSDPHALPFYKRVGAMEIGDAPSDAIPGRRLPLLTYRLRPRVCVKG